MAISVGPRSAGEAKAAAPEALGSTVSALDLADFRVPRPEVEASQLPEFGFVFWLSSSLCSSVQAKHACVRAKNNISFLSARYFFEEQSSRESSSDSMTTPVEHVNNPLASWTS